MVKDLPAIQETQVRSLGQEDPLEKKMATHSSILAWRIPWTEEPGRLQSMRSQRVGHNWAANTFTFMMKYDGGGLVAKSCPIIWNIVITKQLGLYGGFPGGSDGKIICLQCRRPGFDPWVRKIPWSRKWQLTTGFWPGEFHGQRSLVVYSPWGGKELDTTEQLTL